MAITITRVQRIATWNSTSSVFAIFCIEENYKKGKYSKKKFIAFTLASLCAVSVNAVTQDANGCYLINTEEDLF